MSSPGGAPGSPSILCWLEFSRHSCTINQGGFLLPTGLSRGSSSTTDAPAPTPDLFKGSPETEQKPHGTWFSGNLHYYEVPGAALATGPHAQVSAQDLGQAVPGWA